MAEILGWWFAKEARLPHGDSRPVVVGETLQVEPPLILCHHGLHLLEHPIDALQYAKGSLLYRVHGSEEIIRGTIRPLSMAGEMTCADITHGRCYPTPTFFHF